MTDSNGSGASGGPSSSGSGGDQNVTGWTEQTRRYRRGLGGWWWAALLLVPFVLALGAQALPGSGDNMTAAPTETSSSTTASPTQTPTPTPSSETETAAANGYSIVRSGDTITLKGVVADSKSVKAAEDAVKAKAPDATVDNQLTTASGAPSVDSADLAGYIGATDDVKNSSLEFDGTTATLTGTAASASVKNAAQTAAKKLFPKATIDNQITVKAAADKCATLNADVNAITSASKITFGSGGATLTPASRTTIAKVAKKVKACPKSKLTVNGYTDNSGSDAVNVPLSQRRADAVRAQLIADGVPSANVTAKGLGSKNPIAPNNTDANKGLNRRVEILVK